MEIRGSLKLKPRGHGEYLLWEYFSAKVNFCSFYSQRKFKMLLLTYARSGLPSAPLIVVATLALNCTGLAFAQGVASPSDTQKVEGNQQTVESKDALPTVFVVVRKREESAKDVPMSVSAMSGQVLEKIGAKNVRDIGSLFPGVSFNDSNSGGGEFSIRGLTSSGSGSDTSVGLYVDEVFIGDDAAMSQRLFDLNSFQVLRGPQGTLFGRNSVAGAINVVTNKPTSKFGGSVDATLGNYALKQIGGTLNVPLASDDKLSLRVSAVKREREGYLTNLAVPGVAGNDENGSSLRAHLLARPTDTLEVLLSADDSTDKTCDNMFRLVDGKLFTGNTNPNQSAWDGPCGSVRRVQGGSLRADQDLGDKKLTFITASRTRKTEFLTDRDFTSADVLKTGLNTDESSVTHELRLAGTSNKNLKWVTGLFYFSRDYNQNTVLELGPGMLGVGRRNLVNAIADLHTESKAGFASADYAVTNSVNVELGVRYTSEQKSMNYVQTATFPIPGFGVVPAFIKQVTGDQWSPTLTGTLKLNEEANVYGRFAKGYKSGGFNAGPSSDPSKVEFKPEHLDSYEVGYKGSLWNGRLRLDASLFRLEYKDIQLSDQDGAGFFISNAAIARSNGIETQLTAKLADYLLLSAGVGYVDAQYLSYGKRTGNRLPRAPRLTASITPQFTWAANSGGNFFFVPELAFRGENYVDSANTEQFKQPEHTIINLRAGYSNKQWSVTGWVRNVTDKRVTMGGFAVAPLIYAVTTSPPRTLGIETKWNF
jgi:iron complex outermembrane receptor protein